MEQSAARPRATSMARYLVAVLSSFLVISCGQSLHGSKIGSEKVFVAVERGLEGERGHAQPGGGTLPQTSFLVEAPVMYVPVTAAGRGSTAAAGRWWLHSACQRRSYGAIVFSGMP